MASCRVYWNCVLAKRRADRHVLRRLQIDPEALYLSEFAPQPGDDLKDVHVALVLRLERDEHAPVVLRRIADPGAEPHRHRVDRRIGHHDGAGLLLQLVHPGERDVLARLRRAEHNAGVLLREKALGNDDEEIDGRDNGGDERQQGREAVAQHEIDAALVAARERVEPFFAQIVEPAMPLLVVALEEA